MRKKEFVTVPRGKNIIFANREGVKILYSGQIFTPAKQISVSDGWDDPLGMPCPLPLYAKLNKNHPIFDNRGKKVFVNC